MLEISCFFLALGACAAAFVLGFRRGELKHTPKNPDNQW